MKRTFLFHYGMPTRNLSVVILVLGALLLWLPRSWAVGPITPSGLHTQVSDPITVGVQTQHDITGGTRPGGASGTNLFHSFGDFGVPANNIANFLNGVSFDLNGNPLAAGLPTSNILARVTGNIRSDIFGTVQTTGFGNANLFLMNPHGFLFGPNATVNVGGMVAFTTADYLRLAQLDGSNPGIFHANTELTSILTNAPVAAFGFLGSNPAAIEFQGSQLTLATGKGLSLIGGNITVGSDPEIGSPPLISAPSGQINLMSVASPGEALFPSLATGSNINGQTFTTMGTVTILGGSTLDVSDNALAGDGSGGSVRIRGGQFIMDGAFIFANTIAETNGLVTAVSVDITGDISLGNASAISAAASSTGRVGDVEMTGKNVRLEGGSFITTISAESPEQGGNISINSESLNLVSGSSIFSGSFGKAVAGNIAITATDSLNISGFDPVFGSASTIESVAFAGGDSGTVNVQSARMTVAELGKIGTTSVGTGQAGNLSLQTGVLEVLDGGLIASSGGNGSGNITISANEVTVKGFVSPDQRSRIDNSGGGEGGTGNIRINSERLLLTDDARINMEGTGELGTVMVSATESLTISNGGKLRMQNDAGSAGLVDLFSPQITLNQGIVQTLTVGPGNAGDIAMRATDVQIAGAQVNSGTCPVSCGAIGGLGGNVSIVAENSVQFSGQFAGRNVGGQIDPAGPAGIFTVTGNSGGNAGNISVMAPRIQITDGAMLSATSTGSGAAGNVTIQGNSPAESILISGPGSGIFTNTEGTGAGGNIFVNANSVTLQNGGTLSAMTSGTADSATGGTITVNATQVELNLGTITASTIDLGDAGAIRITATDRIALTNGTTIGSGSTNSHFLDAMGDGGTITLHAPHIALSGDASVSSATTGPGNAGNVVLETQSLIMSGVGTQGGRVVTTTQGPGQGGNITVQGLEGPESAAEVVQLTHGSGLFAQTIAGLTDAQGNAGSIHVRAATLVLDGASQLSTTSDASTGGAGPIIVDATDSVHLSGSSSINSKSADGLGQAGDITITSPTIWLKGASFISTSTNLVGNAGNITLHTQALSLTEGSKLTSNSGPQLFPEFQEFLIGSAGSVTIQDQGNPAQSVLIDGSGSGIFTDTHGTGAGGNIFVNANSVTLQNGGTLSAETSGTAATAIGGTITVDATNTVTMNSALITAKSAGVADAGSISITSPNGFTMQSSTITTQAGQGAGGGNIKVTTSPAATVLLQDSLISASVSDGHGGGGNISIDPQFVILQNSQILAQAAQGQGGAITITAGLFLPDANSKVNADSGTGVNGTVTIQSPNAPASGKIQPLGKTPLIATSLLNQHCASLAGGEFSSFTVAGRDSLPTEPGSWLASPLALSPAGFTVGAGTMGGDQTHVIDPANETTLLSLRQIAPAGFLTQAFATDSSTGCS